VCEAFAPGILRFHHIDGKINPANTLSKLYAYPQFWPLLQPLLFWGASFDKLHYAKNVEGLCSSEETHGGIKITIQTGGECQTHKKGSLACVY
jgi:hypothetical protein